MPLIKKPAIAPLPEIVKIKVQKSIWDEVQAYAKWAGISNDYFIEQAAAIVLEKDKDWRAAFKKMKEKI